MSNHPVKQLLYHGERPIFPFEEIEFESRHPHHYRRDIMTGDVTGVYYEAPIVTMKALWRFTGLMVENEPNVREFVNTMSKLGFTFRAYDCDWVVIHYQLDRHFTQERNCPVQFYVVAQRVNELTSGERYEARTLTGRTLDNRGVHERMRIDRQ